ncbi:UNVERIFIED_CONTAM: hypothetical protein Sangu_0087900 [Sesamum angustifolium]|uniref:Endonuclease/exonuclease/phosphatase domain-containing protein n=1 Tax=Sesamum angustifolium TaxID=2727405 RepID=A0AAW2RLE3_9LAMI
MQGPRGAKGVVPMKIISWNCRGLARSKAIRALRAMLIEQKPDIVFLCEIKTSSLAKISQCFHSAQLISSEFVPPVGKAGVTHEQIHLRLKKLRQELRKWNKQTFGWCHSKIKSIENAIKDVQMKDQSIENLALEEALQVELDEQYKRVEVMWKQKAKQRWLQDGDANTRFFHLSTVFKARSNRIHAIKRTDGSLVHSWEEIGNEFLNYYSQLFSTEFVQNSHPFPPDLESLIPQVVSEEDNVFLCENPQPMRLKVWSLKWPFRKAQAQTASLQAFSKTFGIL